MVRVLPVIHQSTVEQHRTCPRRAQAGLVVAESGRESYSGPQAERGKALHLINQVYLETGQEPDYSHPYHHMWEPVRPFFRPFVGKVLTEAPVTWELDGTPGHGTMDALAVNQHSSTAILLDLKSSSDPDKYGLDDYGLSMNPQSLLYSYGIMYRMPHIQTVHCIWGYIRTWNKGAKPKPYARLASCTHTRDNITYRLTISGVRDTQADIVREYDANRRFLDIEPRSRGCRLYPPTGCAWQSACTDITSFHHASDLMEDIKL